MLRRVSQGLDSGDVASESRLLTPALGSQTDLAGGPKHDKKPKVPGKYCEHNLRTDGYLIVIGNKIIMKINYKL